MPTKLVIFLIIVALIFVVYVWCNIVKRKLTIKYALIWLLFSIAMIIAVLIPGFLKIICNAIGIVTVSNFIFFMGFGLLLFITFALTKIISDQKSKITALCQEVSILKYEKENK